MNKYIAVLLLSFITVVADAQQMLVQWNFNSSLPPDNNLITGSTLPSMGNGSTYLTGGCTPYSINPFDKGSDNDHYSTSYDNTGWNIRNFPAQKSASRTAGIVFACNTTGFQNIVIRLDEKHSYSSPNTTCIQYNPDTLNPAGWITLQVNKISDSTLENEWITRMLDLSAYPDANDQPRFAIRVVAAFDPTGDTAYVATGSQKPGNYNPSGGTIRFDMVSVIGIPISDLELTIPSVQATEPSIVSSTNSSIRISFLKGNGDSVLVVCREGYAVNQYPSIFNSYSASDVFGAGSQLGTENFVVYKSGRSGKHNVTIRGLQSYKQYHFAIFEFSAEGIYKIEPVYFHATAGGTLLEPGELVLIGFDTRVPGLAAGNDKHYLTNLVELKPGTIFNLTSSRYEAGAPANVKTRRWYNSGDNIYKDMDVLEFYYTGSTAIPAGSIIGIQNKFASSGIYDSVTVNGIYSPDFFADLKKGGFNVATATTKGEQFYITQGSYYPVGTLYIDRYNLFFGRVLFGLTLNTDWVPLTASPGTASSGISYRSSRIPDDISCLHLSNLSDTVGSGYYFGTVTGTRRGLKISVNSSSDWKWKRGDTTLNISQSFTSPYSGEVGKPFTIQTSVNSDGTWLGIVSNDWFNCANWEGYFVPGASTDAVIPSGAPNYPSLNLKAQSRSVKINASGNIRMRLGGRLDLSGGD